MDKIRLLADDLINRIAAGEVVERPASVVKELVENSLDAGATRIVCLVEEGGTRLVRVTDDGEGMGPEDARLSILRHATSKISSADDLTRISTLGFRGEALSSIAAVSRLRLTTRRRGDAAACELWLEGGKLLEGREVGAPYGTQVEVRDLFFNTPARRKFLRTVGTEFGQVQAWFERLALGRPQVHLELRHGERKVIEAPPAESLSQRAAALLGREVFAQLYPLEFEREGIAVSGLVSSPALTRATARDVTVLVNGRYVRDRLLQGAVLDACRTVVPQGRFPVAVLSLQLDPGRVDVNVHPQKLEVRFEQPTLVRAVVEEAVAGLMARSPWEAGGRVYHLSRPAPYRPVGGANLVAERRQTYLPASAPMPATMPDAAGVAPSTPTDRIELPLSQWQWVGELWNTYLLFVEGEQLALVDQHAAAERITFEKLRAQAASGALSSQRLLLPISLELDAARMASLQANLERLQQLGFEVEPFGPQAAKISAIPGELAGCRPEHLLTDVLDELAATGAGSSWQRAQEAVLARLACHGSVRAGQHLDEQKARVLVQRLEGIDYASSCPHGRPIVVRLRRGEIESWFKRG